MAKRDRKRSPEQIVFRLQTKIIESIEALESGRQGAGAIVEARALLEDLREATGIKVDDDDAEEPAE
jgi:hypothetical protein